MKYNGNIYRPPIEANTLLLPITEGCSHNGCAFCNMYQGIPFRMLSLAEVEEYLGAIRKEYGAFAGRIKGSTWWEPTRLPFRPPSFWSASVSLRNICQISRSSPCMPEWIISPIKSDADLAGLKEAGVNDLYIGVKCGLDDVLENLNKGYKAADIRREVSRLNAAGIRHSDLLMLGTTGKGPGAESAGQWRTLK